MKNNVERLTHRILLLGGTDVNFSGAASTLKKISSYMSDMRANREFVSSQREFSAFGLPAICVEAPLLTTARRHEGDAIAKEIIDVPEAMDPTGALARYVASQAVPHKLVFTDDNWVNYGEFDLDNKST